MSTVKQIGHFRYDEQNILGCGTYGKVYEGLNTLNEETVAIKRLDLVLFEKDKYLRKQIVQEVEIISKLNHHNIVKFVELVATKRYLFIITEMCRNGDLKQLISTKSISEPQALDIMKQIVEGFKELVKNGVIHRDMKPANVLNDAGVVKIADFGFAKYVENYASQLLKSCVGSPLYMAPQVLSRQQYSTKCDIWSLGIIFYEMLFFDVPWKGRDEDDLLYNIKTQKLQLKKDVSKMSSEILRMCLSQEEEQRSTWKDLFSLLDSLSSVPQQIESIDEECIQKVPTWVQKPMLQKQGSSNKEDIDSQLNRLLQIREQLALTHYILVELYSNQSQMYSDQVKQMMQIVSEKCISQSNELMTKSQDLCQEIANNLQKGTIWKIQEKLGEEHMFYELLNLDIRNNLKYVQLTQDYIILKNAVTEQLKGQRKDNLIIDQFLSIL